MHHDQDIRNMGGLKKYMPITYWTSLVGSLALIGTPFFAGFYSKDSIIEAVHASHLPGAGFAAFAVTAGVFVTAFYSFRMFFLVFHGKERFHDKPFPAEGEEDDADTAHDHSAHGPDAGHGADHGHDHDHAHTPHESPWVVTVPLVALAIPSVFIGYTSIASVLRGSLFKDGVVFDVEKHPAMEELAREFHGAAAMGIHAFTSLPFWLALAGVVCAYVFYMVAPGIPAAFARIFSPIMRLLENKYYFDWFNEHVIAALARLVGRGLWKGGDVGVIDGLVNGSARTVGVMAGIVRLAQSGYLYRYALVMVLGVFALLTWQLWQPLMNVIQH
jgi:NADH-quinone oxidoreductase subunit L